MAVDVRNIICFTLNCSDLQRSLAFYVEELGASEFVRMNPEQVEVHDFWGAMGYGGGVGYEAVMLRLGSQPTETYLELIQWERPGAGSALGPRDTGLGAFSIAVDDADAAYAELTSRGAAVKGAPVTNRLGHLSLKAFLVLDPDGVGIELVNSAAPRTPAPERRCPISAAVPDRRRP